MLVLLISGIYLWWPVKRIAIDRRATGRRFWFDLHNAAGIFSLAFLLILTITGLMIGSRSQVPRPTPHRIAALQGAGPPPAPPADANRSRQAAMEIARAASPGTFLSVGAPDPKAPTDPFAFP